MGVGVGVRLVEMHALRTKGWWWWWWWRMGKGRKGKGIGGGEVVPWVCGMSGWLCVGFLDSFVSCSGAYEMGIEQLSACLLL